MRKHNLRDFAWRPSSHPTDFRNRNQIKRMPSPLGKEGDDLKERVPRRRSTAWRALRRQEQAGRPATRRSGCRRHRQRALRLEFLADRGRRFDSRSQCAVRRCGRSPDAVVGFRRSNFLPPGHRVYRRSLVLCHRRLPFLPQIRAAVLTVR